MPRYLSSIPAHEPTTKNCWLSTVLRNGEVSSRPVDPSPAPLRELSETGAALTGLPVGTPVHAGPFDLCASMIGAGVQRPGDGLVILGTTLGCAVLVDRVETDGPLAGMLLCMPEPDRWARVMPAMVGTPSLEWVLTLTGSRREDVDALLAASVPGAGGSSFCRSSLRLESEHRSSIPPLGVSLPG